MITLLQPTTPGTGQNSIVQPKPSWVEQSATPCRYYSDGESGDSDFWYQNEEDFCNGLTYTDDFDSQLSTDFCNETYSLPPYGEMRTTVINGVAWCSLQDVAQIAGVPTTDITGCLSYSSVRGHPGYLTPDGIRNLWHQGIPDEGVRLEAIIPALVTARDGQRLTEWLLDTVIPDIYADFPTLANAAATLVELAEPEACTRSDYKQSSTREDEIIFYDDCIGEFRAVAIGTRLWFRLDDMAAYLSATSEAIRLVLGNERILSIGEMSGHDSSDPTDLQTQYVEFGICQKLLSLSHRGHILVATLAPQVSTIVKAIESQSMVSAGALHRLLGIHQTFDSWAGEVDRKSGYGLTSADPDQLFKIHEGLQVPVKSALSIALGEQTFAGAVTYCLLADGGYLHGGGWDESPAECLDRFREMMSGGQGWVDRRKMNEFMESRGTTCYHLVDKVASGSQFETTDAAWNRLHQAFGTTRDALLKFRVKADQK